MKRRRKVSEALKPIAVKPLVGELGLQIYSIINGIDDEVEYGYSNDEEVLTSTIEYELESGRPYFMDNNNEKQYIDDFIRVNESKATVDRNSCSGKTCIYEALTDTDIEDLSQLNLQEDELSLVLNMFEYITDEHKDDMLSLIKLLFENKKLEPVESEKISESEKYTRMLLGNK